MGEDHDANGEGPHEARCHEARCRRKTHGDIEVVLQEATMIPRAVDGDVKIIHQGRWVRNDHSTKGESLIASDRRHQIRWMTRRT